MFPDWLRIYPGLAAPYIPLRDASPTNNTLGWMLFSRARFSSVVREDSDELVRRERSGSGKREKERESFSRLVHRSACYLCSQREREDVVADASSLIETDTHRLRTSGLRGSNSSGTWLRRIADSSLSFETLAFFIVFPVS